MYPARAYPGKAAILSPGGRTVDSTFGLNVGDDNRSSSVKRQPQEPGALQRLDPSIKDRTRVSKVAFATVDALLRDFRQSDLPPGERPLSSVGFLGRLNHEASAFDEIIEIFVFRFMPLPHLEFH